VTYDRTHSGLLETLATQGIIGLAALGLVLVTLFRGILAIPIQPFGGCAGAACIGYTVWVAFNFDWAPAQGCFWLVAVPPVQGCACRDRVSTDPRSRSVVLSGGVRAVVAVIMALAASVWRDACARRGVSWQGRSDLAVTVDRCKPVPLEFWLSRITSGDVRGGVTELQRAADLARPSPSCMSTSGTPRRASDKFGGASAPTRER